MKKSVKYSLIIGLFLILIAVGVVSVKTYGNYQILKQDSDVLEYFISYVFDEKNHNVKDNSVQAEIQAEINVTNFLKEHCTEECINKFNINKLVLPVYIVVFNKYSLVSCKDVNIEVILKVPGSARDRFYQEYRVSYTYVDKNNKEYNLVDYYRIARSEGKISSILLVGKKSDIIKLYKD